MERGVLVETGATDALFANPQHPYTQRLLNSEPRRAIEPVAPHARRVLDVQGLDVDYRTHAKGWRALFGGTSGGASFRAVEGAELSLRRGETLGIVGESGSGKSTLAAAVLGLKAPSAGQIHIDGAPRSLLASAASRRALYRMMQVVFQDPFGSLSPRMTVEQIVGEGIAVHRPEVAAHDRRHRVATLLEEVGLTADALQRYPHEFSGGQRQRIAIARALAVEPELLILDEPTSALDVSIQQQVLTLLTTLQKKYALSYLFITHDLAVMRAMAHRIVVMKGGRIVESGETLQVLRQPAHPYTRSLVAASMNRATIAPAISQ
jgi:microcin C transport system ATP-binding protein